MVSEKVEQPIIYRGNDSDMSYVKVGDIPIDDITLNTTCQMKRP